jgi:hypothetical protein
VLSSAAAALPAELRRYCNIASDCQILPQDPGSTVSALAFLSQRLMHFTCAAGSPNCESQHIRRIMPSAVQDLTGSWDSGHLAYTKLAVVWERPTCIMFVT